MRRKGLVRPAMLAAWAMFAGSAAGQDKAATVNGAAILASEVDQKLGNELAQLQEQMYRMRRNQLDAMIDQKLFQAEAARRGIAESELMQKEVYDKVPAAPAGEAEKFFEENKDRLEGDFKSLEPQIRVFLNRQRLQARQREFLRGLRAAAKVEVTLARPPIFRTEVSIEGAPARGNAAAPVTIVEFSDFHCGFCRSTLPALSKVREKYGDKVRMIYRDFPLDSRHPEARAVSEASLCAHEQGKFWEFHDAVFAGEPNGSAEALVKLGEAAGLDTRPWDACRKSGKYAETVEASVQEGTRLGITGTPTFFVNGRMLVGAQPVEAFYEVIDEELELATAKDRKAAAKAEEK